MIVGRVIARVAAELFLLVLMFHRVDVEARFAREAFVAFTASNSFRKVFIGRWTNFRFHFHFRFLLCLVNLRMVSELLQVLETLVALLIAAFEVLLRRMNFLVEVFQPRENRSFKVAQATRVQVHVDFMRSP